MKEYNTDLLCLHMYTLIYVYVGTHIPTTTLYYIGILTIYVILSQDDLKALQIFNVLTIHLSSGLITLIFHHKLRDAEMKKRRREQLFRDKRQAMPEIKLCSPDNPSLTQILSICSLQIVENTYFFIQEYFILSKQQ